MKRFILSTAAMILVLMVAVPAFSAEKKVLFIDSYHEGYDWSDGITRGVKSVLEGSGVNLKVIRMDTKRNNSEEFKRLINESRDDQMIFDLVRITDISKTRENYEGICW